MTAIAGLWRLNGRPDAADGCERMLSSLAIYGRHGSAVWTQGSLAVGRCLQRLLPEDAYDRQPIVVGGGRHVLVADVRLDNRDELIRALRIDAPAARTMPDAALLLAAFEKWGEECFAHLLGDYAFALWDAQQRRMILARDPIGQRPLHYHRGNGFFAFASMPKGLHALADVPYAPDEERVAEFLVLMPEAGSRTFFKAVERVEPGHLAIVTASGVVSRRHWEPRRRMLTYKRADDYVDAMRAHLDDAVRSRLRGTGDVAAHLSAGLDSSAVAATAARLLAPTSRRVVALTSVPREGYDNPSPKGRITDEGALAAQTAGMYPNMEHMLIRATGRSPLDDLDKSFHLYDRPSLNICNAGWMHGINDAAKQRRLTVLLTGFLGNLTMSYDGLPLLSELIDEHRWLDWWRAASAVVARRQMRWRGVLARSFGPWMPAALWTRLNKMAGHGGELHEYSPINPQRFAELGLAESSRAVDHDLAYRPGKNGFDKRLWALRRVDLGNHNKGTLAGWGIDQRDPTADSRFIEFCLSVPTEQFLADGIPRALARRALADRLPKAVIEEWRKGYQAADWHVELTAARTGVASEIDRLASCRPAALALDIERMRGLVENWPRGGWEAPEVINSHRLALLRGVATGHFLRRATNANC